MHGRQALTSSFISCWCFLSRLHTNVILLLHCVMCDSCWRAFSADWSKWSSEKWRWQVGVKICDIRSASACVCA